MGKYGNKRCVSDDGKVFDSHAERARYYELRLLEVGGYIRNLTLQHPYELIPKMKDADGKAVRATHYHADFRYIDNERDVLVVEDVKGLTAPLTEAFKLKRKLMLQVHGITVKIVRM